jgi:hypothetical protein
MKAIQRAGAGAVAWPTIIALHASAGSGMQWRALAERARQDFHVEQAAERFVDYWAGTKQWITLAPERQAAIASRVPAIHSRTPCPTSSTRS